MSEILHGVLNMPPELWCNDEVSILQRHSCYLEASRLIKELEQRLAEAEAKLPRWIPVSERLPKSNGDYLISTKHIVTDAEFEGGEFYEALGMGVTKIKGVLAWQELQEVYKPK